MIQKNLKNDWNPGKWVLIRESSARAIQRILTWQGLDGFQKILRSCALTKVALALEGLKRKRSFAIWVFSAARKCVWCRLSDALHKKPSLGVEAGSSFPNKQPREIVYFIRGVVTQDGSWIDCRHIIVLCVHVLNFLARELTLMLLVVEFF